jgi:hypothetical protein
MALTAATKVTTDNSKNLVVYNGGLGAVADNDVLLELDVSGFLEAVAQSTLGSFDVYGSTDGVTFGANALALEDLTSTTPATRVVVSTADKPVRVRCAGFKKLRFQQNTTTTVTAFRVSFYKA